MKNECERKEENKWEKYTLLTDADREQLQSLDLAEWECDHRGLEGLERAEHMFKRILEHLYNPISVGLRFDVGHIIYRLSDAIDEQDRREMLVSSFQVDGSLIIDGVRSASLQDFRDHWEKSFEGKGGIPPLAHYLASGEQNSI